MYFISILYRRYVDYLLDGVFGLFGGVPAKNLTPVAKGKCLCYIQKVIYA